MALSDFFVDCCMVDKISVPDGFGHVSHTYVDGARFKAGIGTDSSTEARIAYQQGLAVMYSIITNEMDVLKQGDRIKRLKDGLVLEVTSDAVDMTTPSVARVKFCKVSAKAVKV